MGQRVTIFGVLDTLGNPISNFEDPNEIPIFVTRVEPAGVVTPDQGVVTPDQGVVTPDQRAVTPDKGVQVTTLPDTGGLALLPIVGAMLVVGGLLGMRMLRRQ